MNYREHSIAEKYRKEGWVPLHQGAPDFLMVKTDGNKQIAEIMAVEVKSPISRLTYEQKIWRDVLTKAGVKFKVEVVE